MLKCKRYIIVTLLCFALSGVKPVHAGFPVFEPIEAIPNIQDITTGLKNLKELKSQLNKMKENLNSIGKELKGIGSFAQDLTGNIGSIQKIADASVDMINQSLGADMYAQAELTKAIDVINQAQNDLTTSIVDNTQTKINAMLIAMQIMNEENAIMAQKENKEAITVASLTNEESIEEEEEEEEIPDTLDGKRLELKQNLTSFFDSIRLENRKMVEQLNDTFDTSLNLLYQTSNANKEALEVIEESLDHAANIKGENRENLKNKAYEISEDLQRLTDRRSEIIENSKDIYNNEYREKILSGINNYEKKVEAFLRQDITKEDLIVAGQELKDSSAGIKTATDILILNELNAESERIKNELELLKENIRRIEQANQAKA